MHRERFRELIGLASDGMYEAQIARSMKMDRKTVRKYLALAERSQRLSRVSGGGRGRTKRYERGPLFDVPLPDTIGGWSDLSAPPEIPVGDILSRIHYNIWKVPVFEDELQYRDHPDLPRKRWTVAQWAGDYAREPWEASGARFYEFLEPSGRWRLCFLRKPRSVRAGGYKGKVRDRQQVATVVLWPRFRHVLGSTLDRGPEITFDDALSLIRDIRDNRKLALHAIPIPTTEREIAEDLEPHPTIPKGRTPIPGAPGVYIDNSPRCPRCRTPLPKDEIVCPKCGLKTGPDRAKPELEARVSPNDFSKGKAVALGLAALKAAPNLVDEIAAMREDQRRLRADVEEILRILRGR